MPADFVGTMSKNIAHEALDRYTVHLSATRLRLVEVVIPLSKAMLM